MDILGRLQEVMEFNGFASLVIGISAGAALTLLLAPRSGKATRRYLSRRIGDGREIVDRGIARVREIGEDIYTTKARKLSSEPTEHSLPWLR